MRKIVTKTAIILNPKPIL